MVTYERPECAAKERDRFQENRVRILAHKRWQLRRRTTFSVALLELVRDWPRSFSERNHALVVGQTVREGFSPSRTMQASQTSLCWLGANTDGPNESLYVP